MKAAANTKSRAVHHATAQVEVQHSEVTCFDEAALRTLHQLALTETFSGDIDGKSSARALQIAHADGSKKQLSVQRVVGSIHGKKGAFVLQGEEEIADGAIHARWFVVPGSGSGQLSGLRGEGGFEGQFGKASTATLDYWFES